MKIEAFTYFDNEIPIKEYSNLYKKINFSKSYPADIKRLEIVIGLLKKYKPKNIVDVGCGPGMPLIRIKENGFNIYGYDKAKNMVLEAKKNLEEYKYDKELIFQDDFENPKNFKKNFFDCIIGLGAFYYSKNFKKTILNNKKKLTKNGRMIFSLRNRLFDISTLNNYSAKFLDHLYETKYLKKNWKNKYNNLRKSFSTRKINLNKNIDEKNIKSFVHNPLTIASEMLKLGLKCEGIYFYHFHAFPPIFEEIDPLYFRKISWKMEKPTDWRGYLLASAFIIDCKKI
jgi:SAM-dependent methyltransferase